MSKKLLKRMATAGLAAALTVGAALPVSAAAENIQPRTSEDEGWGFYISDSSTWHSIGSPRGKDNKSSVYLYWQSGSYVGSLSARVYGVSDSGSLVDCGTRQAGTTHTYYIPGKGQYSIINYVYENGYRSATMKLKGNGAIGSVSGVWSPDSVGSYTPIS